MKLSASHRRHFRPQPFRTVDRVCGLSWTAGLQAQLRSRDKALTTAAGELARVNAALQTKRERAAHRQRQRPRHHLADQPPSTEQSLPKRGIELARYPNGGEGQGRGWCQYRAAEPSDGAQREAGSERRPAPRRRLFDALAQRCVPSPQSHGVDSRALDCDRWRPAEPLDKVPATVVPWGVPLTAPCRAHAAGQQWSAQADIDVEGCQAESDHGSWETVHPEEAT